MFFYKWFSEKLQQRRYYRRLKGYKSEAIKTVAIIYFVPKTNREKYENWNDGFTEAVNILQKDYEMTWINLEDVKPDADELNKFDFLIVKSCWDWIVDDYFRSVKGLKSPRGIVISCSKLPRDSNVMLFYDVLWYQTFWYGNQLKHPKKIHAYGIDRRTFKEEKRKKKYDYLSIGSFFRYKRHHLIKDLKGKKIVIGDTNTEHSESIIEELKTEGVEIRSHSSQEALATLINESRMVYIPAEINGGGERAVLEARSCNVPVRIEDDNPKLAEVLKGPIWDQEYYAQKLKKGLLFKQNGN